MLQKNLRKSAGKTCENLGAELVTGIRFRRTFRRDANPGGNKIID